MVNYISGLVFLLLMLLGAAVTIPIWQTNPLLGFLVGSGWLMADAALSKSIRIAAQWERAVVFRLGRLHAVKGPGLFLMLPLVDEARMVDTRIIAVDIPQQQVITRDNVPVMVNGVLFFRVARPDEAVTEVQDYRFAVSQYAQTSLRDTIGQMTLDELLTEREGIGRAIEESVEKDTAEWGLEVTGLRLQDIDMPEDLKRMMSRQASAEREKRATITKAEGDRDAAVNLALAARTMAESPGAMQLRTLQTIDGLGPSASNTVVLAIPIEVLDAVRAIGEGGARLPAAIEAVGPLLAGLAAGTVPAAAPQEPAPASLPAAAHDAVPVQAVQYPTPVGARLHE